MDLLKLKAGWFCAGAAVAAAVAAVVMWCSP